MNKRIKEICKNTKPIVATPPEYREACKNNYDPGESEFTVTQLLRPPRRTFLTKQHGKPEETPERIWPAFLGTCLHEMMDSTARFEEGGFSENRLYVECMGFKVGGQLDRYDYANGGVVSDFKLMANQQFSPKEDHVAQLQMNGWLAVENDFPVKHLRLLYADKQWSISRSLRDPDYPGNPWSTFVFEFDPTLALTIMKERVKDHADALEGNPRDCTDEEMWKTPDQWAVKGAKAKRARKLCNSKQEAEEIKKPNEIIEHRPGERTFCEYFCGMKDFCDQYKRQS